jgi:hypothetical protein
MIGISGLYYKPITIINGDSSIVNKLETSVTDNAGVIIYNRHMYIVQATDCQHSMFVVAACVLCTCSAMKQNSLT